MDFSMFRQPPPLNQNFSFHRQRKVTQLKCRMILNSDRQDNELTAKSTKIESLKNMKFGLFQSLNPPPKINIQILRTSFK